MRRRTFLLGTLCAGFLGALFSRSSPIMIHRGNVEGPMGFVEATSKVVWKEEIGRLNNISASFDFNKERVEEILCTNIHDKEARAALHRSVREALPSGTPYELRWASRRFMAWYYHPHMLTDMWQYKVGSLGDCAPTFLRPAGCFLLGKYRTADQIIKLKNGSTIVFRKTTLAYQGVS